MGAARLVSFRLVWSACRLDAVTLSRCYAVTTAVVCLHARDAPKPPPPPPSQRSTTLLSIGGLVKQLTRRVTASLSPASRTRTQHCEFVHQHPATPPQAPQHQESTQGSTAYNSHNNENIKLLSSLAIVSGHQQSSCPSSVHASKCNLTSNFSWALHLCSGLYNCSSYPLSTSHHFLPVPPIGGGLKARSL
jgi:hypothetical protein